MIKFFFLALFMFGFAAPTFAAQTFPPVNGRDKNYPLYASAIEVDQNLVNAGLLGPILDYDFKGVRGRVVALNNGPTGTPLNLLLTVNGTLFFVPSHFTSMDQVLSFRRRWDEDAGVFVIVRGYRHHSDGTLVRTAAQIKLATTNAVTLPVLVYNEVEFTSPHLQATP